MSTPYLGNIELQTRGRSSDTGSNNVIGAVAPLYDLNSIPWRSNVSSGYTRDARPTSAQISAAAANVSLAESNVAAANAALTAAQGVYAAKMAEEAAAKANFRAQAEIFAGLLSEQRKAQTGYDAIRRRPSSTQAQIDAALARLNTANAAVVYGSPAYVAIQAALLATRNAAAATREARYLNGTPQNLAAAQLSLQYTQLAYDFLASVPPVGADPNEPWLYRGLTYSGVDLAFTSSSTNSAAQYQHVLTFYDADRGEILKNSPLVRVTWTEVTVTLAVPPDLEDTVSYTQKTEDFSLADAVQQPGGAYWVLAGAIHELSFGSGISFQGDPKAPFTSPIVQCRGTERIRQGWSEYQTPEGQTQAKKYLTMTASGAGFGGRLALGDPPGGYSGGDRPDLDPRILAGSYDPPERPLVVYDSLNAASRPATTLPDSLVPDNEGATILSRTERRLRSPARPAGLKFELTSEQTPGSIAAAAAVASAAAWPEPTSEDPFPVPLPSLDFGSAIRFASAGGDHVIDQSARYKLQYDPQDGRNSPETMFSVIFRWRLRRRNLLTGVVTNEEHSVTKSFPGGDPSNWDVLDHTWTEVTAGENESIEIIGLVGTNASPHLFYAYPSLSVPPG